jgi:hypothetical protein
MSDAAEPYDRALAGAAYVTMRLGVRYRDMAYAGNQRTLHVWRIRPGTGKVVVVRFANAVLSAERARLDAWIAALQESARLRDLPPGAYLHVSPDGVQVLGSDEIVFEKHGQVVHCIVDPGPPPEWRVSVDGADCGTAGRVHPDEAQDEVAHRMAEWLFVNGHLRVPPPPWSWSVLSGSGDEWWVRLEVTGADGIRSCRELVLFDRLAEREHRVQWDSAAFEPGRAELRSLIGRVSGAAAAVRNGTGW